MGQKRNLKIRDFSLSVKQAEVNEDGSFTGYGSVFGVEDSYGEVVQPGAFAATLARRAASGAPLPILWQHQWDKPIGTYDEVIEDEHGLRLRGKLLINDVRLAAEAHALIRAGAVSGLSIGYYVIDSHKDSKRGVTLLTELELAEVSLVTFPANDEARIDAVKIKLARGERPSLPEFERFLREAGFSKTEAAVIANRGIGHLLRSESAGVTAQAEAMSALREAVAGFQQLGL